MTIIDNQRQLSVPKLTNPLRTAVLPHPAKDSDRPIDWWAGEEAMSLSGALTRFKLDIESSFTVSTTTTAGTQHAEYPGAVLAARLIWLLRREAISLDGRASNVKDVTVTVPTEWTFASRAATVLACRIAGFANVEVLEEPVAAFLAVSAVKGDLLTSASRNVLVFDCGGGTLDCSVMRRTSDDGLPIVVARSMEHRRVAGEFVDQELARAVLGETAWSSLDSGERRFLTNEVRKLKEKLNPRDLQEEPRERESLSRPIEYGGLKLGVDEIAISRDLLNEVLDSRLGLVRRTIEEALARARLQNEEIDRVVMVGGSSYIRQYQRVILETFPLLSMGSEIFLFQPEEIVSIGAALYQSALDHGEMPFVPTLALDTYVEYEVRDRNGGEPSLERRVLGQAGEPVSRPVGPIVADILPVAGDSIDWPVVQERVAPDGSVSMSRAVERVKFSSIAFPQLNRVRLQYRIGRGGFLDHWEPRLMLQPWRRSDAEEGNRPNADPRALRAKFGVTAPAPSDGNAPR